MSLGDASTGLTARQLDVLRLLDRRVPIKLIAAELAISESRVNQHIRKLKEELEVNDLSELVARYRALQGISDEDYRKSASSFSELPKPATSGDQAHRVADRELKLSDAQTFRVDAPWEQQNEPEVVPGVLDGRFAVLRRFAFMILLTIGIGAAVIVVMTSARTVGDLLDSQFKVPANN